MFMLVEILGGFGGKEDCIVFLVRSGWRSGYFIDPEAN